MSDRITLVKGKLLRNISAYEYSLIKDDMNGWQVEREAPPVPEEVKAAVEKKAMGEQIAAATASEGPETKKYFGKLKEAATKPRKK